MALALLPGGCACTMPLRRPRSAWLEYALALLLCLAFFPFTAALAVAAAETATSTIDDFSDPGRWHEQASDDVRVNVGGVTDQAGPALRLDFDFQGVSGYATAWRELALDFPDNYELSFRVRGDAPVNNLQFKLVDASGDNVWWINRSDVSFSHDWQLIRIRKRQLEFAWGPTADRTLRRSARIEFVVSTGHGGGRGAVYFDQLQMRALPPPTAAPPIKPTASSTAPGSSIAAALDGDPATVWRSAPRATVEQSVVLDFGRPREFGGLVLHWLKGHHATDFAVQFSDDGQHWQTQRVVHDSRGQALPLYLPESETRYLRLLLQRGAAGDYGLADIDVKDLAFGASANAFLAAVAHEAKRGFYPRGFSGEQSYWTLVGIDGGADQGLLSEDGALETGKSGASLEPFLLEQGQLISWADVDSRQALVENYLPMPKVAWQAGDLALHIDTFASGSRAQSQVLARYRLENASDRPRRIELALALRPMQVNPPTQFLNAAGGVAPIHDLAWQDGVLRADDRIKLVALTPPDGFHATRFDDGEIVSRIAHADWPHAGAVHDDSGYASGALRYSLNLPAHGSSSVVVALPLSGPPSHPRLSAQQIPAWFEQQQALVAASWHARLDRVGLQVPSLAQPVIDTLRTALAHILISRDAAALQPGTRAYARSWIRDGAMMNEALLRLGLIDVAADFVDWYAAHQFSNGKVPCCVDWRGSDPVAENDSQGELIYAIAELYRYGGDEKRLARLWPHVVAASAYMETQRQSERGAANASGANAAFFGLMPASISHEGYSAKPMHSYWDDFWALRGYKDASELATVLGKSGDAAALSRQRDEFRRDLLASLALGARQHGIDYLPGSAELGDFDATSSTIAIAPGGELANLSRASVDATFERYWREFVTRRDGGAWEVYTPYEWRTVGTFVRLGWPVRAQQLLEFFFAGRRPAAWNQWAEVVGREPRVPRFVGDMPHGWVASDFIRSTLDMFAYERDSDRALVIAAGIPTGWLSGDGIRVTQLRTPYGELGYSLSQAGDTLHLHIASAPAAPGGLVLMQPADATPRQTEIDGRPAQWSGRELHIPPGAREVTISMTGATP